MIIKKLPIEIQSLLNASGKINNYKDAIEELVYNSLDAEATSVAIRIHIYENFIQVIDNGFGIAKYDIPLLGERYASSKVTDVSSLKRAPPKFGFRGESLSNIIEVSQGVKITTRHKDTDETWVKSFYKGHHKDSQVTSTRPSKGTTVEVRGFLYNLHIQNKATNPLNELQNIKLFLQQISLVNTNVSISLRDNSRNEVIFKVHKNRDVYQTLFSLYEINKKDLQELQIEKHQYKAKGFIGKQNNDPNSYQWIYLNGRFVHKCALHDMINSNFSKNRQLCRNEKIKNNFHEKKMQNNANEIPTYFIFITCPHLDYDMNITPTKTIIEFKNWSQIRKLLEKLVQFYKGDIKLKKIDLDQIEKKNKTENTREEVRKIMEKVLGNKTKNHRISQLHKSVKGKIMKKKKNTKSSNIRRLKNTHKTGKENTKTHHHLRVPMENPCPVIEVAPVSMNFQVSRNKDDETNNQIENIHGLTKTTIKSKKEKRINTYKLNIEPNEVEHADTVCNYGKPKENSPIVIEKGSKSNHLQVTRKVNTKKGIVKKPLIKTKPLKSKNEKQKIKTKQNNNPVTKQYLKEKAFKLFNENFMKIIGKRINEAEDSNPYKYSIKPDKVFFENRNNIHSFHKHEKLSCTVIGDAPLEKVKREYLKSSDLLKTILNSQKSYSCFNEKHTLQFQTAQKPFEKEYNYYNTKNIIQRQKKSFERVNNKDYVVNNTAYDKNIRKSSENDNSSYVRKNAHRFQNIQFSNKKYSHIEKDMAHLQNRHEPSISLDQYDRHNQVNNIDSNISIGHVYKSFPKLTFESHKYNVDEIFLVKRNKNLKRFISKQSKENFSPHNNIEHAFNVTSNKCKSYFNQHSNIENKRQNLCKHPYTKAVKNVPYFEHKSSHTIEFSATNNDNVYNTNQTTMNKWKYKFTGNVQNTYTVLDSNISMDIANCLNNINENTTHHHESLASYLRFNLSSANDLNNFRKPTVMQNVTINNLEVNVSNSEMLATQKTDDHIEPIDLCEAVYHNNNDHNRDKSNLSNNDSLSSKNNKTGVLSRYFQIIENNQNLFSNNDRNLTSREQNFIEKNTSNQLEENQNVNYCNEVLDKIPSVAPSVPSVPEVEKSHQFQTIENKTLQKNESKNLIIEEKYSKYKKRRNHGGNQTNSDSILNPSITGIDSNYNVPNEIIEAEGMSSHFQTTKHDQNLHIDNCNDSVNNNQHSKEKDTKKYDGDNQIEPNNSEIVEKCCETIPIYDNDENRKMSYNFKLQNRSSFVPKGMSPIFENCNNKNICSYNLETDYFQDVLYNNFANDVLDNIKIFENKVANMNDASEKIKKDHHCLKFDAHSLKNAKVFGQVDRKFIVAELQSDNLNKKHLVLFDQHAVDERIRLEKNLSDYKDGDEWNSTNCETLSLTLSKDSVLYVNNFRDKFKQLGLQWKIENDCLITINAIPKAIFGKHCRQADIIIKSIKNLILEEIKAIKSLGGNTLLYPKSIMDLVFSEACRYAIKFGDKLSKSECATLISSLSSCKTPFQCAHGRPVLAVLSDLTTYDNEYKVDTSKILSLRNKLL